MISIIVAFDENRVIGNNGVIPWKIEGEQKRFKELTLGNTVIMGRRSFEEIGRPLPGRKIIVVSRSKCFEGENLKTASSLDEALALADTEQIFIAGGERLYEEALPLCDTLFITEIHAAFDGDRYFPYFDESLYKKTAEAHIKGDIPYTYLTYTIH